MFKSIIIAIALLVSAPAWADALSEGRDAIELHLVKAGRWNAVVCNSQDIGGNQFVYCHPVLDDSFGGLFAVTADGDRPVVHPVNGKAKQYMPDEAISAVDGSKVAVRPWTGEPVSIPDILSGFQS
ncbi:hypothetical protein GTW51_19125 [Aurantimonas aggregata]|uniref:DUF2511 domain-containing protein n=1 Tax=Aurantimonas aggregata TaxID=2047720 RepID=A0A6L9MM61_9HYPH|nr:hypothetical protein [Aurantimonas aggregata]NDV88811.1 hypothetical protein [Aurantimonas aggregata]